jgi:hypothetical protein
MDTIFLLASHTFIQAIKTMCYMYSASVVMASNPLSQHAKHESFELMQRINALKFSRVLGSIEVANSNHTNAGKRGGHRNICISPLFRG